MAKHTARPFFVARLTDPETGRLMDYDVFPCADPKNAAHQNLEGHPTHFKTEKEARAWIASHSLGGL